MRGKLYNGTIPLDKFLITPAYAGKTRCSADARRSEKNHPRVCGENFTFSTSMKLFRGSPPRMRGKLDEDGFGRQVPRITLAYAGKTEPFCDPHDGKGDHPRVCGENQGVCTGEAQAAGSPPRVRGKPFSVSSVRASGRITPACAGKTRAFCAA